MRRFEIIAALALAVAATTTAQAQIVNPTGLQFDAGAPNTLTDPTQYEVGYFLSSTSTSPVQQNTVAATVATTVSGNIKQLNFAQLPAYPAGVWYFARINAINGGGSSGWSAPATGPSGGAAASFGRPGPPRVPASPALVPANP